MEIERKFLIADFPEGTPAKSGCIWQAYLSLEPEVRIRVAFVQGCMTYKLTCKSDGDLAREEVEIDLTSDQYEKLKTLVTANFISKNYRKYTLDNGLFLECSHVDPYSSHEFMYAEIEFPDEKSAIAFDPAQLEILGKEITYDKSYKMKNFWKETRCAH